MDPELLDALRKIQMLWEDWENDMTGDADINFIESLDTIWIEKLSPLLPEPEVCPHCGQEVPDDVE